MKTKNKLMIMAVGTATMASMAIGSPAAHAGDRGNCVSARSVDTLKVQCPNRDNPGTEFQVVARCPDGLRKSGWELQGPTTSDRMITMHCQGITWDSTSFR